VTPLLELENVSRVYGEEVEVYALRDVSLQIYPGDFMSIVGPSGSGKSTMLGLLGVLDLPTRGAIRIAGQDATYAAQQEITGLLRDRHRIRQGQDDDFMVRNLADVAQLADQSSRVMTMLLASIAGVSLIVGGIGIMNIMLVSVTERTREIGVRMAIGATEEDVQRQFLIEAVVLSLMGGAAGIFFGVGSSLIISKLLGWAVLVSPLAIVAAVIFSAGVGVFFGFYPARKAARLDPIEALRFE